MGILIDKCCHCEKDLSSRENRPNGYYYLSSDLIASVEEKYVRYRLCPECYDIFKRKIEKMNFFKGHS